MNKNKSIKPLGLFPACGQTTCTLNSRSWGFREGIKYMGGRRQDYPQSVRKSTASSPGTYLIREMIAILLACLLMTPFCPLPPT